MELITLHRRPVLGVGTVILSALGITCMGAWPEHTTATTLTTPPPATLHRVNPNGNAGNWYTGAIPPGGGTNLPVLVFVQGLHSDASTWFNDGMYQAAYNSGYRTAFVQLADADGTGGSMQTNGALLAKELQEITSYYQVPKVDIIAHSKGGDDTQAAIVYDGADNYVNEVFELSTPNYGTQLADLAYSWWADWLASLLGQRDAAVYDLQTGQMTAFRNQYDNRIGWSSVDFYTGSGTNHGPWFSSLWWGGSYLSQFGPNDGAVTVASAHLPAWYSTHVFTDDPYNSSITFSHETIHDASNTWNLIQPYLEPVYSFYAAPNAGLPKSLPKMPETPPLTGVQTMNMPAMICRGGAVSANGITKDTFTVDPGAKALILSVLVAYRSTDVTVLGPDGKSVPVSDVAVESDGVFRGAVHHDYEVMNPAAGTYQIQLKGPLRDAYLAVGNLSGVPAPQVQSTVTDVSPNANMNVKITIPNASHHPTLSGRIQVFRVTPQGTVPAYTSKIQTQSNSGDTWDIQFPAPSIAGVYNVSIQLPAAMRGKDGERSITYSFTVK